MYTEKERRAVFTYSKIKDWICKIEGQSTVKYKIIWDDNKLRKFPFPGYRQSVNNNILQQ
jgi:hypothetical protein